MARRVVNVARGDGARVRPARVLTIRATRLARRIAAPLRHRWLAWRTRREAPRLALVDVRRRLELLVAALHDRPSTIEAATAPRRPGTVARLLGVTDPPPPLPATDGEKIRLPATLDASEGAAAAIARYRLLALVQAERIARGTTTHAPPDLAFVPLARLERELFIVAEGAAVDQALGARMAALRPELERARRAALATRPPLGQFPPVERAVERLVRQALGDATDAGVVVDGSPIALPSGATAAESRAWAQATARRLHALSHGYGGVPDVPHWGTLLAARTVVGDDDASHDAPVGSSRGQKTGVVGRTRADGDGDTTGGEGDLPDDGRDRAPPRHDERGESELRAPDGAALDPMDAASRVVDDPLDPNAPVLAQYPEFDCDLGRDVPRAATVRERVAPEGEVAWASEALGSHAALVRRVRERFERLRARRLRLPRQRDGSELDLDAVTRALVDRRLGQAMDERLWIATDHGRRGMGIALLVDVSGSTEARVTPERRVIDVAREAALLASEAFDALGDRYGVFTFSGKGARDVRIATLKAFAERNGDAVRRRIAGIAPDGNTRLGAAVRHASALLAHEPAGHRLLLIVSDGRPNDTDRYFEQYAVEDSRRAVLDARAAGTHVFCLTVDREEGEEYLPRIFGATGFTLLRHPEQLPTALLGVVRQMLGARSI